MFMILPSVVLLWNHWNMNMVMAARKRDVGFRGEDQIHRGVGILKTKEVNDCTCIDIVSVLLTVRLPVCCELIL